MSNTINQIYKSRKVILELFNDKGYAIENYMDFSINEIDAMMNNNQLDMLFEHNGNKKKAYIKYSLSTKQIRWQQNLEEIVEDLYFIENILSKDDDLVIVINDEPNENLLTKLKYMYDNEGIFIVMINIARLQFNILKHTLVPKCEILSKDAKEKLKKEFNLNSDRQLPQISRFDPQAIAMCVRPGEVCKFSRKSSNAINADYYRICV